MRRSRLFTVVFVLAVLFLAVVVVVLVGEPTRPPAQAPGALRSATPPGPSDAPRTLERFADEIPEPPPPNAAPTPAPMAPDGRLVFTYYFYWYDAVSGGHLQPETLRNHPPGVPTPTWRNIDWHKKELTDMAEAGIDVVLPVYWGFQLPEVEWSYNGLTVMAWAWQALKDEGKNPPRIGMSFDTTIVDNRDLTRPDGKAFFYANIKDFFSRLPQNQWARIKGRPVVFLFTTQFTAAMDQTTFDYVYTQFERDFGVRPYIVREVSWDYPILRWTNGNWVRDYQHPITTENSYLWAAAMHGFVDRGGVAAVGPGFDDRHLPDRGGGTRTDREGGAYYRRHFEAAIASGKPLLVIETWNELHEGSGISETTDFGRQYLELTRELAAKFHAAGGTRVGAVAPPASAKAAANSPPSAPDPSGG